MQQTLSAFINLVSSLDPGCDPMEIEVYVTDCPKGADAGHLHLINPSHHQHPTASMRAVPVCELPTLVLSNDAHDGEPLTLDQLLHALRDLSLLELLAGLRQLRAICPMENDPVEIMTKVRTSEELDYLAQEFITYEDEVYENLSEVLVPVESNPLASALHDEAGRIRDDIRHIRRLTLGSATAVTLLRSLARSLGVELDVTLVKVQLSHTSGNMLPTGVQEHPQRSICPALWYACNGSSKYLYDSTLATLPKWAAELYRVIAPDIVNSELYKLEPELDVQFETAEALWRDGGEYQQFDVAYRAAGTLLRN
jgi:hypothetical protein